MDYYYIHVFRTFIHPVVLPAIPWLPSSSRIFPSVLSGQKIAFIFQFFCCNGWFLDRYTRNYKQGPSRTKWTGLTYGWELRPCQFPSSTELNRVFNSPEGFILSHPTFNIIILGYIFIVSENTCGLFLLTGALHHRCLPPHLPLCISVVN